MAMTMVNHPVLNHEWDFCLSRKNNTNRKPEFVIIHSYTWLTLYPLPKYSPIPSRLPVKQTVKSAHLAWCDSETRHVAVWHADSLDQSVQGSFGILSNLVRGSPEDDHRVAVCLAQELIRPSDHPEYAGVGYDPQRGPVAYVSLITQRGGVIHTNHTLRTVDFFSCLTTQDMAGACH